MLKTIQMTIDQSLLEDLDQTVEQLQMTRSSFIHETLQVALRRWKIRMMEKKHADAYSAQPQNQEELSEWLEIQDWSNEPLSNGFEHQLEEPTQNSTPSVSWGAELAHAIQSGELDTSAWVAMDIQDSVQWLKELRLQEQIERASRV